MSQPQPDVNLDYEGPCHWEGGSDTGKCDVRPSFALVKQFVSTSPVKVGYYCWRHYWIMRSGGLSYKRFEFQPLNWWQALTDEDRQHLMRRRNDEQKV